jgi:hypothetical protein
MNARISLIALGVAAALAAGSALAHGGMGHGPRGPMTPEQVTQRMTPLKEALKLQPNQVAAWNAYEGRITANAQARASAFSRAFSMRVLVSMGSPPAPDADRQYGMSRSNVSFS